MKNKTCLVIVGPTAVGKTSLSVQIAKHFKTEIISADSRQCFKELNIGVAKPSAEQLHQVHHYFINSHSIHEEVNTKVFEDYALQSAEKIFAKHDKTVMVGGTGLYIKTFCEGIDEVPLIDQEIKKAIVTNYNNGGIEWLRDEVAKNDNLYFIKGEMHNPQRMIRALEVKMSTGRSIMEFQLKRKKKRDFNIIKVGLELPKEELHRNINHRVDEMMKEGLPDEVKSLLPYRHLNALQTVGYRELFHYLDGEISLDAAVEKIKTSTRQYAKRQMTWFKADKQISWFAPTDFDSIHSFVNERIEHG